MHASVAVELAGRDETRAGHLGEHVEQALDALLYADEQAAIHPSWKTAASTAPSGVTQTRSTRERPSTRAYVAPASRETKRRPSVVATATTSLLRAASSGR